MPLNANTNTNLTSKSETRCEAWYMTEQSQMDCALSDFCLGIVTICLCSLAVCLLLIDILKMLVLFYGETKGLSGGNCNMEGELESTAGHLGQWNPGGRVSSVFYPMLSLLSHNPLFLHWNKWKYQIRQVSPFLRGDFKSCLGKIVSGQNFFPQPPAKHLLDYGSRVGCRNQVFFSPVAFISAIVRNWQIQFFNGSMKDAGGEMAATEQDWPFPRPLWQKWSREVCFFPQPAIYTSVGSISPTEITWRSSFSLLHCPLETSTINMLFLLWLLLLSDKPSLYWLSHRNQGKSLPKMNSNPNRGVHLTLSYNSYRLNVLVLKMDSFCLNSLKTEFSILIRFVTSD